MKTFSGGGADYLAYAKGIGIEIHKASSIAKGASIECETPIRLAGDISMRGHIGAFTYVRHGGRLAGVKSIGRYCSIALDVVIGDGFHSTDWLSTHPFQWGKSPFAREYFGGVDIERSAADTRRSVVVGNDVWLASRCQIMRGVTIGDGAIVAAGCVVTKDVPPYAIFGGVPGRVIRYRFSESIIQQLLELKWWQYDTRNMSGVNFNIIESAIADIKAGVRSGKIHEYDTKNFIIERSKITQKI